MLTQPAPNNARLDRLRDIRCYIALPSKDLIVSPAPVARFARRAFACAGLCIGVLASAGAAELTVSAASSMTNALRDVAPLFAAAHPGTQVHLNFASSGALLQQISQGAPVDVFISADQTTMDQAQARGLVQAAQRRDIVSNTLVVVVPAAGTAEPRSLAELTQPAFARIAIGLPASVPVGRYTQGVLKAQGLWQAIEPKLIGANNVRQALDYVARGEVDAGFVYATDAALMRDKVKVAVRVRATTPILYPAAALAASPSPALADAFVAFLGSAAAQAVFQRYGFGGPRDE